MHADTQAINIDEAMKAEPLQAARQLKLLLWVFVAIGTLTFVYGLIALDHKLLWGSYYTSLLLFMGLSAGSVIITAIWQIVRATWSAPIRRLAEANAAFFPIAYVLLLLTYFGKEHLFPWGDGTPMPGREWWMQPNFVYARFAILFAILFLALWRFVSLSLRADVGVTRERLGDRTQWKGWYHNYLVRDWRGVPAEEKRLQGKLSWNAPLMIFMYAVIYTLFSYEMIIGMDTAWNSNLFPAFMFIGNIYLGWAILAVSTIHHSKDRFFGRNVGTGTLWDLGKLTLGFCMLWGYFFFSQFLTQWYGNLPEETQWMILRTREAPWKHLGWFVFAACFICPFILLISRDLKKTPKAFVTVALLIFVGIYFEKYLIVMPQMSPSHFSFSFFDLGIFLGFLGMYLLSVFSFLRHFPSFAVGHPLTRGEYDW